MVFLFAPIKILYHEDALQAVVNGNLHIIIATVNDLHKRVTTAAMCKHIVHCLAKRGTLENQLYSLTTDIRSNVLKVRELMRSHFALPENFDQNDKDEQCY